MSQVITPKIFTALCAVLLAIGALSPVAPADAQPPRTPDAEAQPVPGATPTAGVETAPVDASDSEGTTAAGGSDPAAVVEDVGDDPGASPENPAEILPQPETTTLSMTSPPTEAELDAAAAAIEEPAGDVENAGPTVTIAAGKGVTVASADGEFSLRTSLRMQLLYAIEAADGEDPMQSLTVRRGRVGFSGHVFGEHNEFKLQLAVAPRDLGMHDDYADSPSNTPILDWYMDFTHLRDLSLQVGQFKVPFNRQTLNSSGNLQMVDRSAVNSEFSLDRDVGVSFHSDDLGGLELLRYSLGAFMARGRDSVGNDDFGMMYAGRIDFLPLGPFDNHREVDFDRSSDPLLAIGVAGAYIDRARGSRGNSGSAPADGGTTNTQHLTADAMFKVAGFSAQTEFHFRHGDRDAGAALDDMGMVIQEQPARNAMGWFIQPGYLFAGAPVEVSGRFGLIRPAGDAADTAVGDSNELGLGLSYYFHQHHLKLQTDFFHLWSDDFAEGAEERFRLQLQTVL